MKYPVLWCCVALSAGCASTSSWAGVLAVPGPGQVSALVVDLDTAEVVMAREPDRLCRPASTIKLLTTASICRRDLDRAFRTRLVCDGETEGQITLVGDGDPLLSAADVRKLADSLARQGVRAARGPVRVVDPLRDAPRWGEGWMWDDEPSRFQPVLSAASVDRGLVTVDLRGTARGLEVDLVPVAGALRVRVGGLGGAVKVTRGRYRDADVVRVRGRLPEGASAQRRISVPDPARYAGHVVMDALRGAGIEVPAGAGVEVAGPQEVSAAVEAWCERAVADVVLETNKASDNLSAEMLLRDLASVSELYPVELGVESETIGLMTLDADLESIGVSQGAARIADGSGLSHYNLLSADALVRLLVDMYERGGAGYALFQRSLPIAGRDGVLQGRMKGTWAEGRVRAKTGTISAASHLAGYLETRSGRRLAFAILCHDFVGSAQPWRALQDRFCAAVAEL